jgi:hypothetical protein
MSVKGNSPLIQLPRLLNSPSYSGAGWGIQSGIVFKNDLNWPVIFSRTGLRISHEIHKNSVMFIVQFLMELFDANPAQAGVRCWRMGLENVKQNCS